jgi:hypothetical protein
MPALQRRSGVISMQQELLAPRRGGAEGNRPAAAARTGRRWFKVADADMDGRVTGSDAVV